MLPRCRVKSTVVPGTTEKVVLPILEKASGKTAGVDFGVGMNPEFLTEGQAVSDFLKPDRIVLGGLDDRAIATMAKLYQGFAGVPVVTTNPRTAEMIKYASNTLLATMISLSNEMANLASGIGDIDITAVMKGVHLSRYLTNDAGETAELHPSCIQAAVTAAAVCRRTPKRLSPRVWKSGCPMRVLGAVDRVNDEQPDKMLRILRGHFPSLAGLRVGVLGLAFRPGTDDMRESPAIPIVGRLLDEGAEVRAYDPIATESARTAFAGLNIKLCEDMAEAVQDVEAVLLVTRWDEFAHVPALIASPSRPCSSTAGG